MTLGEALDKVSFKDTILFSSILALAFHAYQARETLRSTAHKHVSSSSADSDSSFRSTMTESTLSGDDGETIGFGFQGYFKNDKL